MTPHELRQSHSLDPDVVDLADMIETAFGKPVDIRFDASMKVPAIVKVARERMPAHLVSIHPSQTDVLSYLVAHKCACIERIMRVPASERRVAVSTPEQIGHIATLIPDEWLEPSATGSAQQCVDRIRKEFEYGADALIMHGATPDELEPIVTAYRDTL